MTNMLVIDGKKVIICTDDALFLDFRNVLSSQPRGPLLNKLFETGTLLFDKKLRVDLGEFANKYPRFKSITDKIDNAVKDNKGTVISTRTEG